MNRTIKLLEKKLFYRALMEAAIPAIYALINERDKKIYIIATLDLTKSLSAQASQLGRRTHSIKPLKKDKGLVTFKLLETIDAPDAARLSATLHVAKYKWTEHYTTQGYTHYNETQMPCYKARVSYTETYRARVDLVTNGRKVFPVREFKTQAEAEAFIANNSIFDLLIIAKSNKLT